MASKSSEQLARDVKAGRFQPVYYFYGPEDFRKRTAEQFLIEKFIPKSQAGTNVTRIDGKRTKLADILNELAAIPMLGERQVFTISDIQSFKPTEVDKILKMFDPPDPNRLGILTSPSDKTPSKKSAFLKKMSERVTTVWFDQLKSDQAGRMIGTRLQAEGLKIDETALSLMLELIAGNYGALQSETEKIIHYKKDQGDDHISVDDVKEVCSGFEMYTVFQLGQYVAERDVTRALKMVDQLIAIQSSVSGSILYFLGEHFVLLYMLRNGKRLPGSRAWKAAQLRPQAEQFTSERLEEIILKIADTTARMRRQQMDNRLAMEALVVELTADGA